MDAKDVFIDGIYQERSYFCGAPSFTTKYYMAFGRIIAIRDPNGVMYYLSDHLGSTSGGVYDSGAVQPAVKYTPFGQQLTYNWNPDRGYTGQLRDTLSTIGAYYYHARFYSTKFAHFMSADTLAVDGLNRYAYARNNPVLYSDPSGRCAWAGVDCSDTDILNFVNCATGGACPASEDIRDNVRLLSRWVLGEYYFWHTVWEHTIGSQRLNGEILLSFVRNVKADPSGWKSMTDLGWRYLSDLAHVTEGFFKASLSQLIWGGHAIAGLSGWDFAGARPWWKNMDGWGGGDKAIDIFQALHGLFGKSNLAAAAEDFKTGTLVAYLADPNIVWSPEQAGIIARAGYPQPPTPAVDYWRRDLDCYFGRFCSPVQIPMIPWVKPLV